MSTEREKTIFGHRLQDLMDERGLSNERLGDICGVGRQTVIRWKYDYGPSLRELLILAELFDVSLDYMAGLTNLRKGGQMTRKYFNEEWEED